MPAPGQAPGLPYPVPNQFSPQAVISIDPISGSVTAAGVASYTAITTAGTTTLKSSAGVFFGLQQVALGTGFAAVVYDILGTQTNIILGTNTQTAVDANVGPPGIGIRTNGAMVVVTSGTAGQINALWD